MRFVSLFAGVGGFDLGLTRSGHECVGQVEIDKHARSVLDLQFPEIPKHDDVTTAIDWADEIGLTGNIELVCGGFPCQDLSVAGKRAGLAGARSGLFYDALRFATHTKAETILLENVPGLLSSNQGRDFGVLLTALAESGYSNIEWRILDSQFFGVPQRRRRVFIVASTGAKPFRQILAQCESRARDSQASQQTGKEPAGTPATSTRTNSFGIIGGQHPNAAVGIDTSPTLTSASGSGGGHTPIVATTTQRVGNFELYDIPDADIAPTMTALRARDSLVYQVARMQAFGQYQMDDKASTLKSRDYKDVTDIVVC
jgi:DNA (cytosine-5)-methyltransferase 1